MKKAPVLVLSLVLTLSAVSPVFAHGHGNGHRKHSVANCTNTGHTHYYNGEMHDITNCSQQDHHHGN